MTIINTNEIQKNMTQFYFNSNRREAQRYRFLKETLIWILNLNKSKDSFELWVQVPAKGNFGKRVDFLNESLCFNVFDTTLMNNTNIKHTYQNDKTTFIQCDKIE